MNTVDKDGVEEQYVANSVISAVGQLNRPVLPDIPGVDSFSRHSGVTLQPGTTVLIVVVKR